MDCNSSTADYCGARGLNWNMDPYTAREKLTLADIAELFPKEYLVGRPKESDGLF